jgi:SAM-dependent methyltransferase
MNRRETVANGIGPGAHRDLLCQTELGAAGRKVICPEGGTPAVPTLPFTGERIVPGKVDVFLFREHEARYVFAGRLVKDKRVLDVACGAGIGTHYLLEAGAQSCLGLDIDAAAVDYARAAYKGCCFTQCDATNLCLPDESVDVVVSFETIEHLGNQLRFLQECNRVLSPGGILICSTPNRKVHRWANRNRYHFHEFKVDEFEVLLKTVFSDVQLYGQNNIMYFPFVARTLLGRIIVQLHLRTAIRRILRRKPAPLAVGTEFDASTSNFKREIQPYASASLVQPAYVVAVGRKLP